MRKYHARCKTQLKAGAGKERGAKRIEGVEDEERTEQQEVSGKEEDGGDDQEAEGETELGKTKTIRKYDPRELDEQERNVLFFF